MKNSYSGYIIFLRSNKRGQGFGFIYSPESDKTFHFNEQVIAANYGKPEVGDSVDFEEGIARPDDKGPTAREVRSGGLQNAAGAIISLAAVAAVYRHPVAQMSQWLGVEETKDGQPALISILQLLTVRDLVAQARTGEQTRSQAVLRRVGKVVRYKEESGYGFIEQAGSEDVFVHVNSAMPGILTSGAWVVFTQDTNPKDPNKLRATNVKSLASETTYLRANLGTFTDATLRILLENGEESLRAPILTHRIAQLSSSSDFEAAQQEIQLVEKYLPLAKAHYSALVGQILCGVSAWYWWRNYGAPNMMPEEVLRYYREVASELRGDADAGFDQMGTLLLQDLPLSHFIGFFQALWPYARVLDSLAVEQGKRLLEDCRHVPVLSSGISYESDVLTASDKEDTKKAMWLVRYFASLDITGLAEVVWKSLQIILPIPAFVAHLAVDKDAYYLLPLLAYDITPVSSVVAPQLFQRLSHVDAEEDFASLVKLLRLCLKASDDAFVEMAMELALNGCSAFFQVKLWTLGLIPTVEIYQLLEALPSSEIETYLQDEQLSIRLPAATTLLLRAAEVSGEVGIRQGLYFLNESRGFLQEEDYKSLFQIYPAASSVYSEVTSWLEGHQTRPAYATMLHWLMALPGKAAAERLTFINFLTVDERDEFLRYVISVDSIRLLGIDSTFLVEWLLQIEVDQRTSLEQLLKQSRRNDLLLDLWLGGYSQYFDFGRYYLLVATLPNERQFLFLRKVFGLMASGAVSLTVEDLDSIPRHSLEDDNPQNRQLDYSIDLVLKVLMTLRKEGKYPDGTSIINCIRSYSGNSVRQLLQFSTVFEPCPGRTITKFSPPVDTHFALVGNKRYPASEDRKIIFAGNETFKVVAVKDAVSELFEDFLLYNGKRYRITWQTEREWPYTLAVIPSDGKINVSCCEGHKAPANDRTTKSSFWWCFGQPCHEANQKEHQPDSWEEYVLRDFIQIAGLPFQEEPYYRSLGLINRVNQLIKRMYCNGCGTMMHPRKTSEFNFYRDTEFCCTQEDCKEHGKIVYLNRCLNSNCSSVIDSRVSRKCDYEDLGHGGWNGLYICEKCGGCCSKGQLSKKIESLEKIYGQSVEKQGHYKALKKQLALKLYHADNFKCFCHKCLTPMQQEPHSANRGDYRCPTCDVKYSYDIAYLTVYRQWMKKSGLFTSTSFDGEGMNMVLA